jgi:hypothetical protein
LGQEALPRAVPVTRVNSDALTTKAAHERPKLVTACSQDSGRFYLRASSIGLTAQPGCLSVYNLVRNCFVLNGVPSVVNVSLDELLAERRLDVFSNGKEAHLGGKGLAAPAHDHPLKGGQWGKDKLFNFTAKELWETVFRALSLLGRTGQRFALYQTRRSGPSNDLFHWRRSCPEIKRRGRSGKVSSVKRYEKSGRIGE